MSYERYKDFRLAPDDNASLELRLSAVEVKLGELTELVKNALNKTNIEDNK